MSKFAQYYLQYKKNNQTNLFISDLWNRRQELFGKLFESDDGIEFKIGDKCYKHRVYHLKENKNVVVMKIANIKELIVEHDFKEVVIEHNPSCFVVIDNRGGCRRVAIQKLSSSFSNTNQVAKIIQNVTNEIMIKNHNIGLSMSAERYPKDFYKLWKSKEESTIKLRFSVSEGQNSFETGGSSDDDSVADYLRKFEENAFLAGYKQVIETSASEKNGILHVDESSAYIRGLVRYCSATGNPIELVTNDGATYECFVDSDIESENKIVTHEFDEKNLEKLFDGQEDDKENAEAKVIEFVNNMKHIVDDEEKNIA